VVSSGSGGGLLGHAFLTFCPKMMSLDLKRCHAIEYNLDINIGEKFKKISQVSLLQKIEMYNNANFRVYEHNNARLFSTKYLERGQSLEFYRLNHTEEIVQNIYEDALDEKRDRMEYDSKDYDITDNNCVTKAIDVINRHLQTRQIIKTNNDYFDLDNILFQFPIFIGDRLRESQSFDSVILISKEKSYSRKLD
jgi:hypothetical protein